MVLNNIVFHVNVDISYYIRQFKASPLFVYI